ncbi:MAG: transcriptional regulator [Marivirga sp.]|nr:transcriptional regulator [Marivirga sp.]
MKQLTKAEDQIMQIVWRLKTVFIRDVIEELPDPKPHYNTVATIVKILVKKGFLTSELLGNTHQYSAIIGFEEYREKYLVNVKKNYFGNSLPNMIAYFAKGENLSESEIKELIKVIKSQKH